jgi:hypothetical protein
MRRPSGALSLPDNFHVWCRTCRSSAPKGRFPGVLIASLLLLYSSCPPTSIGPEREPHFQVGTPFFTVYGFYLDPDLARAPRSAPSAPMLPLWDLDAALAEVNDNPEPDAYWIAWSIARAQGKPATAHSRLIAALSTESLSAARLVWWREQVVNDIEMRDALLAAWAQSTDPSVRALLATALALAFWEVSCPVAPAADGACRVDDQWLVQRDPVAVERAIEWTKLARKLRRRTPKPDDRAAAHLEWSLNLAAMVLDYEAILSARLPDDLTFMVEDWLHESGVPAWERAYERQLDAVADSHARAGAFFESYMACNLPMSEAHFDAIQVDADVAALALLREATLRITAERTLRGNDLDRDTRQWERDAREAGSRLRICVTDTFSYVDLAEDALEQCLDLAARTGAASATAKACEARLSEIDAAHPVLREFVPEPASRGAMQREGVVALEQWW